MGRGETKPQKRFEIEDFKSQVMDLISTIWGVSSAGRAPALQAGGHRFDPGTLHHKKLIEVPKEAEQERKRKRKGKGSGG